MKLLHKTPGIGLHVRVPVNKTVAKYLKMIEQDHDDIAREIKKLLPVVVGTSLQGSYIIMAIREALRLKIIKEKEAMAQVNKMDKTINNYIKDVEKLALFINKIGKKQ